MVGLEPVRIRPHLNFFPPAPSLLVGTVQDYMMETQNDDKMESAYSALASGYGFASFCYILAFILAVAASVYYSPLFCGTDKERRMIKSPEEVGDGYAMYNDK